MFKRLICLFIGHKWRMLITEDRKYRCEFKWCTYCNKQTNGIWFDN